MCLILFQLQEHPNYKLILAANRDEAYERPTATAQYWQDKPEILAGRDLLQMGTWLGITKSGRIAGLTNYRDPMHMKPGKNSRGAIVTNYLSSNDSPYDYLKRLDKGKSNFVGFNVIVGNLEQLMYYNNIEGKIVNIKEGTHGLSNHFLNTSWPKVEKGKKRLQDYVMQTAEVDHDALFDILSNAEEEPEDTLPDTGVGLELEKKLSPMFINMPNYGTRCSTVLTIDRDNHVTFIERTFHSGKFVQEVKHEFKISDGKKFKHNHY